MEKGEGTPGVARMSENVAAGGESRDSGEKLDHLSCVGDVTGIPLWPKFSWENEPLDLFMDSFASQPLGLSSVALSFPPSDMPDVETLAGTPSPCPSAEAAARPLSPAEAPAAAAGPTSPPVISVPEQAWSEANLLPAGLATIFSSTSMAPPALPTSPVMLQVPAFVPAVPPIPVVPNKTGLTSADWEEAAVQGVKVSQLSFFSDKAKTKRKGAQALSSSERLSRPLGITGWAALGRFKQVKASPLHLWVRSDRYPALEVGTTPNTYTRVVPKLKALLPNKLPAALPHSLSYIECGFVDSALPLDRCRVLCPTVSSWESHQFLSHALGYLCTLCHNWLASEPALQAHSAECSQKEG